MRDKRLNPGYSSYTPQRLIVQLSSEDYGRLQEKLYRFPGFFIQKRILRQYAFPTGANILGNIREVNRTDIERDPYYAAGDYTGDLGVEKATKNICAAKGYRKYLYAMPADAFRAATKTEPAT